MSERSDAMKLLGLLQGGNDPRFKDIQNSPLQANFSNEDLNTYLNILEGKGISFDDYKKSKAMNYARNESENLISKMGGPIVPRDSKNWKMLDEIENEYYNKIMSASPKKENKAMAVIGPPASRKSTLIEPLRKEGYAIVDSDEIAPLFKNYYHDGLGASSVHRAANSIKWRVADRLAKEGVNSIVPFLGTGDYIKRFDKIFNKRNGYNNNDLIQTQLPEDKLYAGNFKRIMETGRYTPPTSIKNRIHTAPKNYDYTKNLKGSNFKNFTTFDMDVPRDSSPKVKDNVGSSFLYNKYKK